MVQLSRRCLAIEFYIKVSSERTEQSWMGCDIQLLWCPWNNVPNPVLSTEHKPRGTNGVGDEFAE